MSFRVTETEHWGTGLVDQDVLGPRLTLIVDEGLVGPWRDGFNKAVELFEVAAVVVGGDVGKSLKATAKPSPRGAWLVSHQ